MSKTLELAVKLQGHFDASFGAMFKSADNLMNGFNKKVSDMKSKRDKLTRFDDLNKSIVENGQKLTVAKQKVRDFSQSFTDSNARTAAYKAQVKAVTQEVTKLEKAVSTAKKGTQEKTQQLEAARAKLEELKKSYSGSAKETKEFKDRQKEAEKEVRALEKSQQRQNEQLRKTEAELRAAGVDTNNYRGRLREMNSELALAEKRQLAFSRSLELSNRMRGAGQNYKQQGLAQMRKWSMMGAGIGATIALPAKFSIDFEESFADIKKLVDFQSKEEEKAFQAQIRMKAKNSSVSAKEYSEIVAAGAQSDIPKNDLLSFADDAAKMKVAWGISAEAAGEFMAKTRTQLGLTQNEMREFGDTINYLSDNTASKAEEIANISRRVGNVAKSQNVSKESNAAYGATLVGIGKEPEVAATALKKLYVTMGKGEYLTNKQAGAFKQIGLEGSEMAKLMQENSDKAIEMVLERIKKIPKEAQTGVLNAIVGEESVDSIMGLVDNLDKLKENIKKAHSEAAKGSMEKEYQNRMKTTAEQMKKFKNNLVDIGISLGNTLLPVINQGMIKLKPFVDKLGDFIQKNPKLVSGLMKAALAVVGLNLAMGAGKFAFGGTLEGAGKLLGMFTKFKMIKTLGLAKAFPGIGGLIAKIGPAIMGLSGPIGWIIGGVVAIGAAFIILYKKSTWFRNGVNKAFNMIKPHVKELANLLRGYLGKAFDKLKEFGVKHGPAIKKAFDDLKPVIKAVGKFIVSDIIRHIKITITVIKAVVKVMKFIWPAVKVIGKILLMSIFEPLKLIKIIFKGIWDVIKAVGRAIWNHIGMEIEKAQLRFNKFKMMVAIAFRFIKFVAQSAFRAMVATVQKFVTGAKAKFNDVKARIGQVWDSIKQKASSIWESILTKVKDFIKNFKDAIKAAIDWVKEKWNDITNLKMPSLNFFGGGGDGKGFKLWAKGGHVTRPQFGLVGEAGSETVVPHRRDSNSMSLWYEAGAKLGMFGGSNTTVGGGMSITYAPVIHGSSSQEVASLLKRDKDELKKQMAEWERQQRRTNLNG